jgi:hypothetical protein
MLDAHISNSPHPASPRRGEGQRNFSFLRIATGIVLTGMCLSAAPLAFGDAFGATAIADTGKSRILLTWYPPVPMPGEEVSLRVEYIADKAAYKGVNTAFASARVRAVQDGNTVSDKGMQMGNGYATTQVTFDEEGDAVLGIDVKTKEGTTVSGSFPVMVRQRALAESDTQASSAPAIQLPLKTGTIDKPELPSWRPPLPKEYTDAIVSSTLSNTVSSLSSSSSSSLSPATGTAWSSPGNLAMPVVEKPKTSPLPIVFGVLFVLAGGVGGWLWMRKRGD